MGFISEAVLPLGAFSPKSVPGAPEAQGGARRTFPRPLCLSLLLKTQGTKDARAGMGSTGDIATRP